MFTPGLRHQITCDQVAYFGEREICFLSIEIHSIEKENGKGMKDTGETGVASSIRLRVSRQGEKGTGIVVT